MSILNGITGQEPKTGLLAPSLFPTDNSVRNDSKFQDTCNQHTKIHTTNYHRTACTSRGPLRRQPRELGKVRECWLPGEGAAALLGPASLPSRVVDECELHPELLSEGCGEGGSARAWGTPLLHSLQKGKGCASLLGMGCI